MSSRTSPRTGLSLAMVKPCSPNESFTPRVSLDMSCARLMPSMNSPRSTTAERLCVLGVTCSFFFFSSRRRHTRLTCDWSSDVCSSDLGADLVVHATPVRDEPIVELRAGQTLVDLPYPRSATAELAAANGARVLDGLERSEERRVGKECRSRGWPDHSRK